MTSGTSGAPKGLVITHGQQLMRYLAMHATLGAPQGLRYLSITPLSFAAGRTQYLYHLLGGNTAEGLDAHRIQPFYAGLLARACGVTAAIAMDGEKVVITAQ